MAGPRPLCECRARKMPPEEQVAEFPGVVIGKSNLPLANEGDVLFHVARFDSARSAWERVEAFQQLVDDAPPDGQPPIV